MIDLGKLNYEEKEAIEELRMRVEKELDSKLLEDETLYYRFLKARDFNIDKAEKMLRKHLNWRKAKQINTILKDFVPKEIYTKLIQPSYIGKNKKGDLVLFSPMGKIEASDVSRCFVFSNYLDHWVWFSEQSLSKLKESTKKRENPEKTYPQVCMIFDLDQLTFTNATSKYSAEALLGIMSIMQDNFPEGLDSLYIINAPRYYVFTFSIVKTIMSNAMIQKFSVFGKDGWKEALLKVIDADVLPAFLGGNRTDPDGNPLCHTFISYYERIPDSYTLSTEDRYFKDETRIQTVHVPKNGRKEAHVDITEEESVIELKFLVKHKDIGIGLYHEDSELTEILPVLRYHTYDGTSSISYKTKATGKYILLFDNSYSWMNSKEVQYTIKVIKPNY